ncbi:Na+/H+ antiporter NhaC [Pseudovibrio flavus]|uniref:Na+/H+ antiporter NhaC n=1 Tax=Pseudovibrio flavus TaxID=2529854 RepID=UPI00211D0BCC|nr:Na+/H+ antiporter NhaC [Pseudovibrio flavus]
MSTFSALIPIVLLVSLLCLSYILFSDGASSGPNQVALLASALAAALMGRFYGISMDDIRDAAVESVATGLPAVFILFAVGALIGTWAMSGTIMAMIYYGLQLMNPHFFYVSTVIICALVSLSIGSSWTVAGTVGIGLMGVAHQMGMDPAITAGAVISGAYFGDKSSPLSDCTNLATAAAGANLYVHIKETLWTSVPALALTLVFFWFIGTPASSDTGMTLANIEAQYNLSLVHFLPLLLVLGMAVMKCPPFTTIFVGALAGGVLAVATDPTKVLAMAGSADTASVLAYVKGVWAAMSSGYVSVTGDAEIDALMTRGGMESMLNTVWLIMSALAFGGVIEKTGILERILEPVFKIAKSTGALVTSLVSTCIATNALASDQYMAIVIPGRMFKTAFVRARLRPEVLSRAVGDSATVTSALIPWNSCGAYMAATLGVPTLAFAGFAFFNIITPIVTIAFALFGWRMLTSTDAEVELEMEAEAPTGPHHHTVDQIS